jgi:hypothetical protein
MEIENKIESKIKDFFQWINLSIVQNYYIKNNQNWDAICASLHIINDLQRPKREYYSIKSINHLEIIGIMQTIYIEQDSIQTLKNSILEISNHKFSLTKYDKVRNIRNKIFGHPSDKSNGKIKTRHFFDIEDKKTQLIKHLYWGTEAEIEGENIILPELIKENSNNTLLYLNEIEENLKNKFKEMMNNYKIKFENLFRHSSYTFEKILTKNNDTIAINSFDVTIYQEIENAKNGLIERNIYENFEKEIEVMLFLSNMLKKLFYEQTFEDIEFYTYASVLFEKVNSLKMELKKIDKI